jgi:MFS family permease
LFQVTGLGALVLTPVVGNLSDRYGRKALLALPATASIVPLGNHFTQFNILATSPVVSLSGDAD